MSKYYSFLSHVRQGIATGIQNESAPAKRPTVNIDFKLKGDIVNGAAGHTISDLSKAVKLYGPGDILGISPNSVLRTSPLDWITNFEYNFIPYIEFYDEDFPWRYTPFKSSGGSNNLKKLTPWLALVVLKEDEFEKVTKHDGTAPSFITKKTGSEIFQDSSQLSAWAHVHVNDNLDQANITTTIENLDDSLRTDPNKAVSRILCPRKLEKDTGYTAFLIPSFEHGRRVGLDQNIDAPTVCDAGEMAFSSGTPIGHEFPIYHEWFFKTSNTGDFESLVEDISPVHLDADSLGTRLIDIQNPGDLDFLSVSIALDPPTQALGGAIRTLDFIPSADTSWDVTDDINGTYIEKLRQKLNTPYDAQKNEPTGDPVISAPLYGRWHAMKDRLIGDPRHDETTDVLTNDWFTTVNTDPRFRVFASAGAEAVKKNQEYFMDICWKQVDKIIEANKKLKQLKLAQQASKSIYTRSILTQSDEGTIVLTNTVHDRVNTGTQTVYADAKESKIPNSVLTGTFRKLTRENGFFASNLNNATLNFSTSDIVADFNNAVVQVAPPYTAPTGFNALSFTVSNTFNQGYLMSQPRRNNFYLTVASSTFYNSGIGSAPTVAAHNFQAASFNVVNSLTATYPAVSVGTTLDMANVAYDITFALNPDLTILNIAKDTLSFLDVSGIPLILANLNEIMATPKIELPMAKYLYEVSPDLLIPGVNSIPQNSVSALGIDQRYIEAFMVGLNHEMMRELLWREYPTDQRGTVFSRFWGSLEKQNLTFAEAAKARSITNINTWAGNALGNNFPIGGFNPNNSTILVVRGELLKKYPKTFIYAQKALFKKDAQNNDLPEENRSLSTVQDDIKKPVFITQFADIAFIGFDLGKDEVKGNLDNTGSPSIPLDPGYFFVFKEITGEINFGLDIGKDVLPPSGYEYPSWDSADWISVLGNFINTLSDPMEIEFPGQPKPLNDVEWGKNSADMAFITYRRPSMVAYHAINLIL